jgi:hypothetical protein
VSVKRTAERETFLADIITTAVEGGYSSLEFEDYRWHSPEEYMGASDPENPLGLAPNGGGNATVTAVDVYQDGKRYPVTPGTIATALGKIRKGEGSMADSYRKRIVRADATNDAGDLDAIDADIVLQMATLADVIYG